MHQAMAVVAEGFFRLGLVVVALPELPDQALVEQAALVLHQEVWAAVVLPVVLPVSPR